MVKNSDIIPDESPVVTLEQAKGQLRIEVEFTDDDALITQMAASAQAFVQAYIGRPLAYGLVVELDEFGTAAVEMACLPDASLTKVEYIANEDGEYADLPEANYKFKKDYSCADQYTLSFVGDLPALPESNAAVRITMRANCPEPVRSAILLRLTELYDYRHDRGTDEGGKASMALARPFKTVW